VKSARDRLRLIGLIALALRLAIVLAPGLPPPGLFEDAYIALNIAAGHGYCQDPYYGPTAVKAPAYPLVLAAIAAVAPHEEAFVLGAGLLNALLGGLACWLVGRVGGELFGDRTGVTAAALLAVYPVHAYLARIPESTNLSIVLAALALRALIRLRRDAPGRAWALAGACGGLAALGNPLILPGLGVALLALGRRRPRHLLLAAIAMLVVLTPWTLRNRLVLGELIVIKSPLWLDIYAGFVPENLAGRQVLPAGMRERIDARALGHRELEREAIYRQEVLPWMLDNPGTVARTAAWRLGQFFGLYGRRPQLGAVADALFRVLPEAALLALALVGLVRAARVDRPGSALLVLFWLTYAGAYAAIVAVNVRYHLEIVWVESILAAAALARPRSPRQTILRK